MVSAELIRNCSLFAGLDPTELDEFLRIFQRVTFEVGACLVRQGQPADSAFILESGTAEVMTALPGGGEATVARLGPGSVLGEMALLESGVRSATVVARTPLSARFIERDGFRMLLAQRNDAAFCIQHRVTLTLCGRLRELNARILACDAPEYGAPDSDSRSVEREGAQAADVTGPVSSHIVGGGRAPALAGERAAGATRRGACSFDYKAFLPVLPLFRRFTPQEIEALAARADVMELPRGRVIFEQGTPSEACYVVVRGAVEVSSAHNGRRHRIGIIGPGQLCGHVGLVDGSVHGTTAVAREQATLLEIGKDSFGELYGGRDRLASKFQDAINQELLQALARTNNHLTRLISQARIRDRRIEELQRALCTQDCRAA